MPPRKRRSTAKRITSTTARPRRKRSSANPGSGAGGLGPLARKADKLEAKAKQLRAQADATDSEARLVREQLAAKMAELA